MKIFKNVNEVVKNNGIKCVVYGASGMGKTVLTATCPKPFVVSAENGLLSLNPQNLKKIYGDDPIVAENIKNGIAGCELDGTSTITDLQEIYLLIKENKAGYQTVVFDSVSEIADLLLKDNKKINKNGLKAYGDTNDQLLSCLNAFKLLPINVVFIAQMKEIASDNGGIVSRAPMLPGKQSVNKLPYIPDEIFFYKKVLNSDNTTSRVLITQPDTDFAEFVAKDRSGVLEVMEAPHLGAIFSKINKVNKEVK